MRQTWGPTAFGKLFTGAMDWSLTLSDEQFLLKRVKGPTKGHVNALEKFDVEPGIFWSRIFVPMQGGDGVVLGGIPNDGAAEMLFAIKESIHKSKIKDAIKDFKKTVDPVLVWVGESLSKCQSHLQRRGWLTKELVASVVAAKPTGIEELFSIPEIARHIETGSKKIKDAVAFFQSDFNLFAERNNKLHAENKLRELGHFFDNVEKAPLSQEQREAVLCFDNRVLLVASAGSGKTSTLVAKAGYALQQGYFAANRILLLAFNNDAAAELRVRIKNRLEPLGLQADQVMAKTFHAFGLDVIGLATGKRPSLAPWLEYGKDLEALLRIVDDLRDQDASFRSHWDMYRLVFSQDLPKFGEEHKTPDSWNSETSEEGFWTLNGETVKSRGERIIANWLFYNGVTYEYEKPYRVDTADAKHRQYRPDFYFPELQAYLEHWAIDRDGNPPVEFVGYRESMEWKKKLHEENGTTLLETTMADLWSGNAFTYLEEKLTKLGVTLDPNPERPSQGRQPIENPRLARTFRNFLTHVKCNRLSIEGLHQRLEQGTAGEFKYRHKMFLALFEKIWKEWEVRLKKENCIDFDDMLNLATDYIELGRWKSPYELILVDEFQDASYARTRLISGLVKEPDRYLFAVGDDWQSINRFAGSDLSAMTGFESMFGPSITLKLETTFRCPQSLCDISSAFIQKNPGQIKKRVHSFHQDIQNQNPFQLLRVSSDREIQDAVMKRIESIASLAIDRVQQVYVLGRYNDDRKYMPAAFNKTKVNVQFMTVHSSKGLEADHIIIPRMTSDVMGFPSGIEDDPVLQLAMPSGDNFPVSEERRLFYVAMTRSKNSVMIITVAHKESPFLAELVRDHRLQIFDADGQKTSSAVCPECKEGILGLKAGRYGPFLGCGRWPKCKYTENLPKDTPKGNGKRFPRLR